MYRLMKRRCGWIGQRRGVCMLGEKGKIASREGGRDAMNLYFVGCNVYIVFLPCYQRRQHG